MHLKRFEAATLADALREVREAFGPDALVLSTRTLRRGSGRFGRFGRPVVEVTAARERDTTGASAPGSRGAPDPSWRELQLTRALVDPLEREVRQLRQAVEQLQTHRPLAVGEEVAQLRQLVADLRGSAAPRAGSDRQVGRLLAAGLAPRHAAGLGEDALRRDGGDDALLDALAARLDARIAPAREDDPPVSLYVGPTGAGKTTSLAKVAARDPELPALLTADAQRLGADAALRRFAKALKAPFAVAGSPEKLAASVSRLGRRRVLVDTAGRSRSDAAAIAELRALRAALGAQARVHLVLSATTKERDLRADVARYAPLEPDALVVTKLDDSDELGNVVNLLLDPETPPLVWLGDGQRVPEDLRVPDPRTLAARVLGGPA